jgi:hypothetical protein
MLSSAPRSRSSSFSSVDEPATPDYSAPSPLTQDSTPTPTSSPKLLRSTSRPQPAAGAELTRSSTVPRIRHKHSSSLDNPRPRYIRTQPVGLSSSPEPKRHLPSVPLSPCDNSGNNSPMSSNISYSPVMSSRRSTFMYPDSPQSLSSPKLERPLRHRCDSLPVFPPPASEASPSKLKAIESQNIKLEDLPVSRFYLLS